MTHSRSPIDIRGARRPIGWRWLLPRLAVACGLALPSAACHSLAAPRDPATAALFRDLERQVTVTAAAGWGIDRLEVEELLEPALDSVCRVDRLDRSALRTWIADQISVKGGSAEQAWRERGRDLDRVQDLLVLTRMKMLLARAEEVTDQDCPFWLESGPQFRGRQISHGQWQLSVGGGGKGIAVRQGDRTDLMAGGAGRLLLGRVLANGNALYLGAEIGGSASFPKDSSGERSTLVLSADLVVPVVARLTFVNSYLEFEAGWLGRSTEQNFTQVDHGVHVGVSLGARALRTRFFFPGAALGISLERLFVDGEDLTMVKIGARFALDFDL